jgi:hypothetical protein
MYRRVSVQLRSLQPLVCKDDDDELVEHITRGVKVNQPSRTEAADNPAAEEGLKVSRPFFYVGTSGTVLV